MTDQVKQDDYAITTITPYQPSVPSTDTITAMIKLTELAVRSGMAKAKNQADAFFICMYGLELGIPPMTALRTIYSVSGGAPTCSGEAMLALIRRSGKVRITISSTEDTLKAKRATVHMKRLDSGDEFTATWGEADDNRAALKSNRDKYPAQMWQWRAVSIAAKALCSDIIGGLYTIEEIYPDVRLTESGDLADDIIQGSIGSSNDAQRSMPRATLHEEDTANNATPGASPVLVSWATADKVKFLLNGGTAAGKPVQGIRQRIQNITDAEICKFAGIASLDDLTAETGWAKYNSGKEAVDAIMAAFEAQTMQPAQPKNQSPAFEWTEQAIEAIDNWLSENFWDDVMDIPMMSGPMLAMLEVPDWSGFSSPTAAREAARNRALAGCISFVVRKVHYMRGKASYFLPTGEDLQKVEFEKYGLREWLGKELPGMADSMKDWQKGSTYELPTPVVIKWERKNNTINVTGVMALEDIPF